ncbi:hypothetical protein NMG60_11019859 [Bertholletia excelsa]
MASSTTSLIIHFLTILAIFHPSFAQNSPKDFVDAHNVVRTELDIPPLTWNASVAAYAYHYAVKRSADCALEHSMNPNYGENIAEGFGDEFSGADAVKLWASEKPNYDYHSNSCVGGECLHYTQVVWRKTKQIGCAKVRCRNKWSFITCNYYPPGNYEGERPY